MPLAAHPAVIEVSTDDITYNEVDGINDFSFSTGRDVLDTTDFKDTSGAKTKILGLQDTTISLSGDLEASDTNGQNVLRTAFFNGNAIYVGFGFNGTDGYKVQARVSSFEINAGVGDKVEFSCEITSVGAVSTYTT